MNPVEDKRTAILEATLRLISKNGFHGTSMSKIANEAGVSAGIIYHYFDGKDDLIEELYRVIKGQFGRAILRDFDPRQPLSIQIRQILDRVIRYYLQHPLESAFVEQFTRSPYFNAAIEEEVGQYYLPALESLQRAQQEGIVKDLPGAVIATLTFDVATSLSQKQAAGLLRLDDALIERIVEATWEAVRQ